ncbi:MULTISPECIES: DNA-processing protein DprA [Dermacoccus]|uniref:DNA-processing protein DprA n=1 Tax=Dermacoccus TaxID=57495 RepID=UPI00101DD493|nr:MULTISPECIES: DNA-processing protein DprA [Dermacoccus]MBE7371052.1 DNA-protecting protein DprA [Dermacoccus barathri]MBZ4497438.1 DNA-processing protein DprA [Dermacoccus sp. Tok2021]RYI21889.1 DNA-protecting protein DprA [Dermacoccus sp. 147Ba]
MTTTTSRNDLLSGTGHAWRDAAEQDEQLARLVWAHIAEPRDAKAQLLIDGVGYPEALAAVRTHPEKLTNFAARLEQLDLPEQLRRIETFGARILLPSYDGWPERLDDLPQPPHALFVVGEADVRSLCERSVALVGARAATHYGQRVAAEIALGVGSHGVAVVSGGAFGIDAAAHRGALAGDAGTVCVLPGGVDRLYPSAHDALFSAIRERGAIVSEMPLGFAPMRQRFLHRNRLIAALTPGTVVVEAGLRSGSLSTARRAEEIQRVVGAVPGPVTSAASAGCHELVRDGAAVLVTGADDVIELMAGYGAQQTTRDTLPALVKPEDAVGATARAVWDALPVRRAASVDHVATSCGRTPREVLTALGELLAAGLAEKVDGAWRKA